MFKMCSVKSARVYLKNIRNKRHEFKKSRLFFTNINSSEQLRFFARTHFAYNDIYLLAEKLPLRTPCCFLQIKNHFGSRSFIFKPLNKNEEKELLHISLTESLQNCKSAEEQIKVFHSLVKLTDESIHYRYSICEDIERLLQPHFPSCFVHLIGSSVNGFGFKGCDVDLSIQFDNQSKNGELAMENKVSSDESKTKDPVYNGLTLKHQLLSIKNILVEANYEKPFLIIPGRCPILNFNVQNLSCDLAVNNRSALHSTNLMLLCGKLDERVLPLTQIIIYWAKHSNLVGGPVRFKTYAIFLMVTHFLQTRNPPILPSVETIFEKTDFLDNLDNWSYDVTTYVNKFEKSRNSETVEELLKEFFIFYRSFDFSRVICPLKGTSVDKKLFTSETDGCQSFHLDIICIQDLFEQTWNVTSGVNWRHCKSFSKALISAWEKCQDQSCWTPGMQNWGLASLIVKNNTK